MEVYESKIHNSKGVECENLRSTPSEL